MKKKILISFGILISTVFTMLEMFTPVALAGDPVPPPITVTKPPIIPGDVKTPLVLPGVDIDKGQGIYNNALPTITGLVLQLAGGLSLLFVIISGIQLLTAYGNEEKIGPAKKTLTFALAGLVISLLSYAIVQIIVSIKF